ncbi:MULTISPECIES: hypothetical protein [unclassified Streptomyces]|uniref:hypothetical protein n=1 Tax=unclassified Streptomyces TaxID=2593676 RepID=UPI0033A41AE3
MGMPDVWVRAQSIVSGSRTVRADTIVQVKWERQSSQYLTLVVKGGDEVHHQVRPCGSGAEPLTEKDGSALTDGLLSAMAKTAAVPGSHLMVLDGTGVQWCRTAMDNTGEEPAPWRPPGRWSGPAAVKQMLRPPCLSRRDGQEAAPRPDSDDTSSPRLPRGEEVSSPWGLAHTG